MTEQDEGGSQRLSFSSDRAERLWKELFGDTLTPEEVGDVLGVDRSTVMRWLREKTLVGFQTGRTWRIREADLREYVQRVEKREREAVQIAQIQAELAQRETRMSQTEPQRRWAIRDCLKCGNHTMWTGLYRRADEDEDGSILGYSIKHEGTCEFCGSETSYVDEDTFRQLWSRKGGESSSDSASESTTSDGSEFDNMPF